MNHFQRLELGHKLKGKGEGVHRWTKSVPVEIDVVTTVCVLETV